MKGTNLTNLLTEVQFAPEITATLWEAGGFVLIPSLGLATCSEANHLTSHAHSLPSSSNTNSKSSLQGYCEP